MEEPNPVMKEMRKKHDELIDKGISPFAYGYDATHAIKSIQDKHASLGAGESSEDNVSIAGRLMTKRDMGKASFADIQDQSGRMQLYLRADELESYDVFKMLDLGDIIGVKGFVFKSKRGELSIHVKSFTLLSKALRPLPEKYHGIKDPELRYRKRYLDLIMNPEEKERFVQRTRIIGLVREFLNSAGFLEVETPVLQVLYGGTNAKPFKTHINAYNMQMYLRVAPELYLKRLLVGGFEKVYEIARNFRNEGVDATHNPEFTMIEWYEAYGDYNTVMDRAESMYKFIAKSLFGKEILKVQGNEIDISHPWPKLPMKESIKMHLGIDVDTMDEKAIVKFMAENKVDNRGGMSKGQMVFAIFDKLVCTRLMQPVWIIDYPKEVSPLAKVHRDDPSLVERFECYIGGREIGDGWTELVSPIEQKSRFENEQKAMRAGNDEAHPMDADFLEALEHGMPPAGGIGIGIDRLVMLFTDCWSIRDVLFFPIMKPETEGFKKDLAI